MRATGRWDDEADRGRAAAWCSAEIDRAVAEVAAVGPPGQRPTRHLLFDNVCAAGCVRRPFSAARGAAASKADGRAPMAQ